MAPQSQVVVSIVTGIISSIIGYIQLNIAMLSYQADYERMRATLVRLLSIPVGFLLDLNEQMLGGLVLSSRLLSLRQNFRIGQVFLYRLTQSTRVKQSPTTSRVHRSFVSFSRIRVDARKRNESAYVWTRKLLNPQQNVCGYKRIRIRVDRAL